MIKFQQCNTVYWRSLEHDYHYEKTWSLLMGKRKTYYWFYPSTKHIGEGDYLFVIMNKKAFNLAIETYHNKGDYMVIVNDQRSIEQVYTDAHRIKLA